MKIHKNKTHSRYLNEHSDTKVVPDEMLYTRHAQADKISSSSSDFFINSCQAQQCTRSGNTLQ